MKKRNFFAAAVLFLLLALGCVGGMELAFCAKADPALFETVTAPAVALGQRLHPVLDAALARLRETGAAIAHGAQDAGEAVRRGAQDAAASCRAFFSTRTALCAPGAQIQTLAVPQTGAAPAVQEAPEPAHSAVTELLTQDGREVLTGGVEITYYNQKDEAWAEASFGGDPVGRYGCGPTALSMAVSSLTGTDMDPAAMAAWCAGEGYRAVRSGSYLTIVEGTAAAFGLACQSLPTDDAQALTDALRTGRAVAVALMGPGHFTDGGHFIVLHGVTQDGQVLAADPNSRENSLALWDPQLILDELSESRSGGAPLWLLTADPSS